MDPRDIIETITRELDGVRPKETWGETSFFYNPGDSLPHGVYFCTLKEKDGENDQASYLDRPGVFRLSIGIGKRAYEARFGPPPARPAKGQSVATEHDFTAQNVLLPHPVYAWMGWVCILSPSEQAFNQLKPLIRTAHQLAVDKFNKRTGA